ncbi:MAG TPA: BMP family ABC transporter substrate-binding protein [Rectinemataceae bacterium]|nr:BMP family ABC transporter substrate-binding protein [Rectinemataceae bacterium]
MKSRLPIALAILVLALPAFAKPLKIGVFIPGVREGSPTYADLASGAEKLAAETPGASVKVFEAGFNQAEWQEKLTSFVATGGYDFILTSNPSLPDLIGAITPMFPGQKFICLDGMKPGIPNLYTVLYNQTEQGYITGYLAGLLSLSSLPGANPTKKTGMIIGQHYPVMDKLIIPGFEQGLKAADPAFQLDVRVLGNWYDATKAAELASSMIDSGVDVILPICGSASQGVIKTAQDAGKYLVFFDSDEYARAPKTILGCTALRQEKLAYTKLKEAVEGKLAFGKADIVGIKEGYIEMLSANPSYLNGVPKAVQAKVADAIARIKNGTLSFKVPQL